MRLKWSQQLKEESSALQQYFASMSNFCAGLDGFFEVLQLVSPACMLPDQRWLAVENTDSNLHTPHQPMAQVSSTLKQGIPISAILSPSKVNRRTDTYMCMSMKRFCLPWQCARPRDETDHQQDVKAPPVYASCCLQGEPARICTSSEHVVTCVADIVTRQATSCHASR